jgi:hypothetical protein
MENSLKKLSKKKSIDISKQLNKILLSYLDELNIPKKQFTSFKIKIKKTLKNY